MMGDMAIDLILGDDACIEAESVLDDQIEREDRLRIAVVDDDPEVREVVVAALEADGFAVDMATTYAAAEALLRDNNYDVVIADRVLSDGDTIDLVRSRREAGDRTPVLFLSARDALADRLDGFAVGGDDYVGKPFLLRDLVLRVRTLSLRSLRGAQALLRVGDLEIDKPRSEVRRDGEVIHLTGKELCILVTLANDPNAVVSRQDLVNGCWDDSSDPTSNVCDVHIASLRKKLGAPDLIKTVRGVGFTLRNLT